jgi:hypothetical protein
MMANDKNVRIVVEAITKGEGKLAGLQKSLGGIGDSAKKLGDSLSKGFNNQVSSQLGVIGDAIGAIPGPLGIAAGAAGLAGAALVKMGLDTASAAIEFDKLSQKTGASVEFLSGMSAAVRDADIDVGTFNQGIVKFADNLSRTVGPTANVQDELFKLADAFAQMPDGAQKTALAIDAFGRAGAEMIPILNEGGAGLRALMADAQSMGRVMSTETVEAAKKLDDQIDKLNARIEGMKQRIGAQAVPALLQLTDANISAWQSADTLAMQYDAVAAAHGRFAAELALLTGQLGTYAEAQAIVNATIEQSGQQWTLAAIQAEYNALAQEKVAKGSAMAADSISRLEVLQRVLNTAVTEGEPAALALAQALLGIPPAAAGAGLSALLSGKNAALAAGYWRDAAGVIVNAAAEIAGARYAGMAKDAFVQQNNAQSKLISTQDKLKQKGTDLTAAYRKLYDQTQANVAANDRYGRSWEDLTTKIGGGGGAIKDIDAQLKSLEDRAASVKGALAGGAPEFSKNEKLQTAYAIATGELSAEQFTLQQSIKAVVAANEAGALSTDQAVAAALSAAQGLASAQDLFALAGEIGTPFAATAAEVIAAAEKAATKVNDIRLAIEKVPPGLNVDIEATIKGMNDVRELRTAMDDLHSRHVTWTVDVVYRTTGAAPPTDKPPGFAGGGRAYGWAWVGERGPELVYFGQPGQVFSNTQSDKIAGGDAPGMAPITVNVAVDRVTSDVDVNDMAWRVADVIYRKRRQ